MMTLRMIARTVALLLVATALTTTARADDESVLRDYHAANGLLNRGHYRLAIDEYERFLAAHAEHEKAPVARYGLGVCHFRLDELEPAIDALAPLTAIDDFAYAAEVSTMIGRCHVALKQYDDAVRALQDVLDDHGAHALADDAAVLQIEALYALRRYADVERAGATVAERWPECPSRDRVELYRGLALVALKRHRDAATRFADLAREHPDSPHVDQALLLHAQSLHRAGRATNAVPVYRAAIATGHPEFAPEAMYGLAVVWHEQAEPAEATPLLDTILTSHATHRRADAARLLRGRIAVETGDHERAEAILAPLAKAGGPDAAAASYWLARNDLATDRPERAARRLEQVLASHPKDALAASMRYDRAIALVRAGDADTAIAVLEHLRQAHPNDPLAAEALFLIATTLHREGRHDESLEACDAFDRAYPEHARADEVAFLRGENHYLEQQWADAADAYAPLAQRDGDDDLLDDARFRYGMALYHQGRADEATPWLAQSFDGPSTAPAYRGAVLALGDISFQDGAWRDAQSLLTLYLTFDDVSGRDDAWLKLGLARQRQGDAARAVEAYDALLAEHPDSPHVVQATFERGQALVALERTDEASAAFEAVLATDHDSRFAPHAHRHLGAIALAAHDHDGAADHFAQASAHAQADANLAGDALYQRGRALLAAGRSADAADAFAAFIDAAPESSRVPEASAQRAIALARADEPDMALDLMAEVERDYAHGLDPATLAGMRYDEAWCLRALERPADAKAAYARLVAMEDGSELVAHGRLELAELHTNDGEHERAATQLTALLETPDLDADLAREGRYRLGACAFERGRFKESGSILESYAAAYPDDAFAPSAALLAGESFLRTNEHSRALPLLESVVTKHPDTPSAAPALLRLGECRSALQQWAQAEKDFTTYLATHRTSDLWFQARFGLGWAKENQQRYDEAIQEYRLVIARHRGPTAARAQFQIGECLYAARRYEDAASELLKVDILYAYPEWSAAALYEAGRCFQEMGQRTEARTQFEQVARDHASTTWAKLAQQRLDELADAGLPGRGGDDDSRGGER